MRKIASNNDQLGQTLIETLVAIFILVTGLGSAIGLAIYSFRATDASSKQIVATALARQSVEGVKNIRDSNWLNSSDDFGSCGDLGSGQQCYKKWQTVSSPNLKAGTYAVDFSAGTGSVKMTQNPSSYILNYDSSTGQYVASGSGTASIYSRKVVITEDSTPPYTNQNPRLIVVATVWWHDQTCPVASDPTTLPSGCKVILEMHLTNWKNY